MARTEAQPTVEPIVEVEFPQAGIAVLVLRGEQDLSTAPRVTAAVAAAARGTDLLVDLSDCTFIDSTIIATLLSAQRGFAARGGRTGLVVPPEAASVRRVITITQLDAIIPVSDTRLAAMARLRAGAHVIRLRDLRTRFGDKEALVAECSCGWVGTTQAGTGNVARAARREGSAHVDEHAGARRSRRISQSP